MGIFTRGGYVGRLSFDPDSGFHTDLKGNRVVSEDGGKTWRYAKRNDISHLERYHATFVTVAATTGSDEHHTSPKQNDPHLNGVIDSPDHLAVEETGHTRAYSE
jgi:hypothetical protein